MKFQEEAMKLQQKARDKAKGRSRNSRAASGGDAPLEPEASGAFGRKIGHGRAAIGGALIGGRGNGGSFALSTGAGGTCAICRRSTVSASRRPRPASATRTGPISCWPSWRPAPPSPESSRRPNRARRRSTGARQSLKAGEARALVVNSGNANAFTGKAGVKTVTEVAGAAAKLFDAKPKQIFQASTGVIGEPLDPAPLIKALTEARRQLAR